MFTKFIYDRIFKKNNYSFYTVTYLHVSVIYNYTPFKNKFYTAHIDSLDSSSIQSFLDLLDPFKFYIIAPGLYFKDGSRLILFDNPNVAGILVDKYMDSERLTKLFSKGVDDFLDSDPDLDTIDKCEFVIEFVAIRFKYLYLLKNIFI